jgi:hypothetical protein
MSKTIAIMQPTYLPWLGYLAMIEKVDKFVFLDNVQFDHRSWQQRNRIKTDRGELWLTLSVKQKGLYDQKINQVLCIDLIKDVNNHLKSMSHYFSKTPFFKDFFYDFAECAKNTQIKSKNLLSEFNIQIIEFLCKYVGIEKKFVLASQIKIDGQRDALLANICQHFNAKSYLSSPGSRGYLENSHFFKEASIEVVYHDYSHPAYPQLYGEFIEGMSCVDAFFNVEREKLKTLIMSGCK